MDKPDFIDGEVYAISTLTEKCEHYEKTIDLLDDELSLKKIKIEELNKIIEQLETDKEQMAIEYQKLTNRLQEFEELDEE